MATFSVEKVEVWAKEIEDRAGALDEVLGVLAEAGVNLACVIARREHEKTGKAMVYVTPLKGVKETNAGKRAGLVKVTDMATLRVEGANKKGNLHTMMAALAEHGINVRGISAVGMGPKGVGFMGFDTMGEANEAMGVIKAIGSKGAKKKASGKKMVAAGW